MQSLAFRDMEPASDKNENFYQVVRLMARHNLVLKTWTTDELIRSYHLTHLNPLLQNEFIKLLSRSTEKNL